MLHRETYLHIKLAEQFPQSRLKPSWRLSLSFKSEWQQNVGTKETEVTLECDSTVAVGARRAELRISQTNPLLGFSTHTTENSPQKGENIPWAGGLESKVRMDRLVGDHGQATATLGIKVELMKWVASVCLETPRVLCRNHSSTLKTTVQIARFHLHNTCPVCV